jgi:hypothetical protein
MEKLSSDTGYFKKPVEINRGSGLILQLLTQPSLSSKQLSRSDWAF